MTLRLVALISAVLLLSLAAFGLLMGYYQNQMVQVVADTASDVGRATLRALDLGEQEVLLDGRSRNVFAWSGAAPQPPGGPKADAGTFEFEQGFVVTQIGDPDEVRRRVRTIERIVSSTDVDEERFVIRGRSSGEECSDPPTDGGEVRDPECLEPGTHVLRTHESRFYIDVEDVRVRSDLPRGLVMTISTLVPAEGEPSGKVESFPGSPESRPEAGEGTTATLRVGLPAAAADPAPGTADLMLARQQVQLPIELGQYEELARRVRGRSLALFLGVFAVGMVLSTGLAARFTRPIRKLDAGIRRLSEGDLDVRVDVRGKDEIGRLSRAFNEMARKLRASRDQGRELMRREKLSALGRMAAGVAHDVRNPLHSIGLTLQHLRETARPGEEEQAVEFDRSLEIIRGEIQRLDKVVGRFLSFARSEHRERERIDLGELLRETARLVHKEAERRNVELELRIDAEAPSVLADPEALRSSVLNLVLNSFEAMPDGGRLELASSRHGDCVEIEIADTGQGIAEEEQERVFDFAYTTREGGNGLGLAMVHHCVVEGHGGQVLLESEPGEGTRVRMRLPLQRADHGGAGS
jgi:signal transduction histidine kinase